MPVASGSRLGPYEILAPLGAGGMGEVYKAHDPRLGRDVAIKVLPAEFSADPDRLRRFEQEARAAAALNHPNILAVYDIGYERLRPARSASLRDAEREASGGGVPARRTCALHRLRAARRHDAA
jgi:serine/threonine protein kinase